MKSNDKFNLIVIGSGAAGSAAAYACRKRGWEVLIIDSNPFGGTCALRGCDPKKVLVGGAEFMDWQRRFLAKKIIRGNTEIDWPALIRFKKSFTGSVSEHYRSSAQAAGIELLKGRARFVDDDAVQVGEKIFSADYFLIAAGAKPQTLGIPGEEHLATSTQFLELAALPRQIVFVGGRLYLLRIRACGGAGRRRGYDSSSRAQALGII